MRPSVLPDVKRIDEYRTRQVLTWTQLCRAAGLSDRVRPRLRNGRPVSVASVRAVAKALGVEPARLIMRLPKARGTDAAEPPDLVGKILEAEREREFD